MITIAGAVAFGYWQGSLAAGIFMFCLLMLAFRHAPLRRVMRLK